MKKSQLIIVVLAAVAIGLVVLLGGKGGKDGGSDSSPKAPAGALKVKFVYSPEKELLLKPLIARFNADKETVGGKQVFVEGEIASSGDAETEIEKKQLEPTVWSPSSSLWGRLLNFQADQEYVGEDNRSIVRTPLVIAMWEPMAKALGYPKKKIGFSDILRLATSNQGWAAYGKPAFGSFKLVHTNPDFSTSGLSAVVAEYYAATGKQEGLTEEDVSSSARKQVRDIEHSIVHYGDTTLFIADQMKKEGPGYASAAAMEEVTLLDFNKTRGSQQRLVAIYPKEGTFYSDNPFIVLKAPWVTEAQRQAADKFGKFLAEAVTPELAAKSGFRPADITKKPAAPITAANGVDPAQPKRALSLPEPRVLDHIMASWRKDRKPANVLLVLDTSGSMNDEGRLEQAKRGLQIFLREVSPNDRVGLTIFSDRIESLVPIEPVRDNRQQLQGAVRDLIASGGTALYDATTDAVTTVRQKRDRDHINAVVILTDGEDTDSTRTIEDAIKELAAQGDSSSRVRVYTIAYGSGASGSREGLKRVATASGGKDYVGNNDDIEAVYRSISSFF